MHAAGDPSSTVRALARELGLACTPVVIADRSNVVLALEPHALVSRVAMATSTSRVGFDLLGREIAIARFLDGAGASVTRPARFRRSRRAPAER